MVKRKYTVLFFVYSAAALFLVALLSFYAIVYGGSDEQVHTSGNYTDLDEYWINSKGKTVSLSSLDYSTEETDENGNYVFTTTVPMNRDSSCFAFASTEVSVKVYYNDTEIYSTGDEINQLYGKAPGKLWNYVNLAFSEGGDQIKLVITKYYESSGTITESYLGSSQSIIIDNILRKPVGILCVFALSFIALAMFIAHFCFRKVFTDSNGLLEIALFSVGTVFQVLLDCSFLASIYSNYSLANFSCEAIMLLASIPIYMYVAERLKFGGVKKLINALVIVRFVDFAASMTLHMNGVYDLNELSFGNGVFIEIANGILLLALLSLIKHSKKHDERKRYIYIAVSWSLYIIATAYDCLVSAGSLKTATLIAAMLVTISVALEILYDVIYLFRMGMKAKKIDKLAYTDGLTGIGNTTAFREKLEQLEQQKARYSSIGIVQLDINNLKTINDTLGHSVGDELIYDGSQIINNAFSKIGECYRIGGDEFAVIVSADHAPQHCNQAIERFEELIEQYNKNGKKRFKMQIAYGVAFYENSGGDKEIFLREIQKEADVRMYTKKREMKAKQSAGAQPDQK